LKSCANEKTYSGGRFRVSPNAGISKSAPAFLAAFCIFLLAGCNGFVERTITVGDEAAIIIDMGDGVTDTIKIEAGTYVVLPPPPPRPGYTFVGWYTKNGVKVADTDGGYTAGKDEKIYVGWTPNLRIDAGDSLINNIPAVRVLAGTFIMGSPPTEPGRYYDETQHEVTLTKSYWISKYPVTKYQLLGMKIPTDEHILPAANITWQEAFDFAESKGGTLPTEAQWEFAARGGGKTNGYIYSGSGNLNNVAWYDANAGGKIQLVGRKTPNELGIYDMSGNVYEWCFDWYGYLGGVPATDPAGPDESLDFGRVIRGGSFESPARECRVADRPYAHPEAREEFIGFRIVWEMNE
jgi:uncharacterized repeat protein (TIGR02543 family)